MSDPPRLLESAGAFEGELLRSWHDDAPPRELRGRLHALAPVAAGAALPVGVVAGAKVGGSIAPKALSSLAFAKWLGGGALLVALSGATAHVVVTRASEPPPPALAVPPAQLVTKRRPAIVVAPTVSPSSEALPEAIASVGEPRRPAPRANVESHDTLSTETDLVDRARASLAQGDAATALRLATDYEREYPRGIFRDEAAVLRIHALFKSGQRSAGEGAARAWLAQHPKSPHAPRVRALLP